MPDTPPFIHKYIYKRLSSISASIVGLELGFPPLIAALCGRFLELNQAPRIALHAVGFPSFSCGLAILLKIQSADTEQ